MSTALVMLSLITLVVVAVGVYDWLSRRKDSRSEHS